MSTEIGGPSVEAGAAIEDDSALSLEEARAMLDQQLAESDNLPAEAPEATAEEELAKANADPEKDRSEDTEAKEETPPIDPPASWTKAEKERFQSLPRETQEYLHSRENERDRQFLRSQNEIAEQRKAIETERSKAEDVRKQYEAQLPALMQRLESANQATFSDIKTMDDVKRLQSEDPFRFQAWQVHQMDLAAAKSETDRIANEKTLTEQSNWQKFVNDENSKASEFIPELADKAKGPALMNRAAERLSELGFNQQELANLASGKEKLSLLDHRIQRLIYADLKLADIQAAPKAVAPKTLPPVQKPGTARQAGESDGDNIRQLNERLTRSGSEKDAWALMEALEKQQARRSTRN